jgi:hypothetical protein
MKMKKWRLISVGIILVIAGCRDVTDVRSERGKGQKRTYNYSKNVVFKLVKESLISLGFALGEINESEGYISGETPSQGALGFKSGEIVGIWVTGNGGYSQVEIAWLRRAMLDPAARSDWTVLIFKTLEDKLNAIK